jgi:hypothetical protein
MRGSCWSQWCLLLTISALMVCSTSPKASRACAVGRCGVVNCNSSADAGGRATACQHQLDMAWLMALGTHIGFVVVRGDAIETRCDETVFRVRGDGVGLAPMRSWEVRAARPKLQCSAKVARLERMMVADRKTPRGEHPICHMYIRMPEVYSAR